MKNALLLFFSLSLTTAISQGSLKNSLQKTISAFKYDFSTIRGAFLGYQEPYIFSYLRTGGSAGSENVKRYDTTVQPFQFAGATFHPELYYIESDALMYYFSDESKILTHQNAISLCAQIKSDLPALNVYMDRLNRRYKGGEPACICMIEELGETNDGEGYFMFVESFHGRVNILFMKY